MFCLTGQANRSPKRNQSAFQIQWNGIIEVNWNGISDNYFSYSYSVTSEPHPSTAPEVLADVAIPAEVENVDYWKCGVCTVHNFDMANPVCDTCGHKNEALPNPNTKSGLSQSAEKPSVAPPAPTFWACQYCTLENDLKAQRCGACEKERSR